MSDFAAKVVVHRTLSVRWRAWRLQHGWPHYRDPWLRYLASFDGILDRLIREQGAQPRRCGTTVPVASGGDRYPYASDEVRTPPATPATPLLADPAAASGVSTGRLLLRSLEPGFAVFMQEYIPVIPLRPRTFRGHTIRHYRKHYIAA